MSLTLEDVDRIAVEAHAGQVDKIGVPYVEHVRAVAAGLAPFGVGMQMAGLLHDTLEDTHLTPELLLAAGVPYTVVTTVRRVTNRPGVAYQDMLLGIAAHQAATLVKISDNAHNSRPDRAAQITDPAKRARLAEKYANARGVLWPAVPAADVAAILRIVNPSLLPELLDGDPS